VYGQVVRDLTAAAQVVGLDPYEGVYHRPRFGRPALALDLAEEFRPIVGDSTMLRLFNNGELRRGHFVQRNAGVALTADGRRKVIAGYERRLEQSIRHPIFGYTVTYRRLFELQMRLFAAWLMGEVDEYTPFTTR
jgi:CRISPR-associated protein Cas1